MRSKAFRDLFAPPDPAIVEAGAGGERLIARMRVIFWGTIWLIPVVTLLTMEAAPPEVRISFFAATLALVMSLVLLPVVRRHRGNPIVGAATSAFDITLITVTLAVVALAGRPLVAINSLVIWPIYLLAILTTSLRLDLRIALFAGLLSTAQYGALLIWSSSHWDLSLPEYAVDAYGAVSWPTQSARVMMQLVATALACGLVYQSRKLAQVSGTDRLTRLGNRLLFDERLIAEVARAARTHAVFTLAFLDIDRFKSFNDRWGHDAADEALRQVAAILRDESRASDSACRWGGEELVLILPETDRAGAVRHLDRIRDRLEQTAIPGVPEDVRVTFSAGVAEFPADAAEADTLRSVADRRMLEAKRQGRNRVIAEG